MSLHEPIVVSGNDLRVAPEKAVTKFHEFCNSLRSLGSIVGSDEILTSFLFRLLDERRNY
jgi:hypothetical protein